jgi:hypothetical protein
VAVAGCSEFLTVPTPTVINSSAIDPVADAATLGNSAQQNFATAYGLLNMYTGWMAGEATVAETFPTRNEFGRREVVNTNSSITPDMWRPLSRSASSARNVLALALPTPTTNIVRAQAALFSAYSFQMMAETFCAGTVGGGAKITVPALLDSAIANFTLAIDVGRANGTATGTLYKSIAFVGRARANLQRGSTAAAATDADSVPAGFTYSLPYIDDAGNRTRLSNTYWQFIRDRGSISVNTAFRTGDSRLPFVNGASIGFAAQDASSGIFWVQQKWPGYGSAIRLASKLEADYIKAEATGGTAGQLALIAARRTAAGLPAYAGATDAASVLTEFFTQKGFDFWLEGKRLGDIQRYPTVAASAAQTQFIGLPPVGGTYFKPGFAQIGNAICTPVPFDETSTNKNYVP